LRRKKGKGNSHRFGKTEGKGRRRWEASNPKKKFGIRKKLRSRHIVYTRGRENAEGKELKPKEKESRILARWGALHREKSGKKS